MSLPSSAHRAVAVAAMIFACIAAGATPGLAQGGDRDGRSDDEQIVLSGELIVPNGQSVSTAVSLNGDATIEGTVTETLVVLQRRRDDRRNRSSGRHRVQRACGRRIGRDGRRRHRQP